jgi:uncharacterized repeat protein (TIGR01451 family)
MSYRALISGLVFLLVASASCASAQAAVGPRYDVKATWSNTNLPPGGKGRFAIRVRNVGDATGSEDLIVKDQLPAGLTITNVDFFPAGVLNEGDKGESFCTGKGTSGVECVFPGPSLSSLIQAPGLKAGQDNPEPSGYLPSAVYLDVDVAPEALGVATNTATVSGGGAAQPDFDVDEVSFSQMPSFFGIVPGSYEADVFTGAHPFGEAGRQAGDRPFELRVNFDFTLRTTEASTGKRDSDVNALVKSVEVTLPRAMIGNPEAVPKCDPVAFAERGATSSATTCPPNTQVGYLNVLTTSGFESFRDRSLSRVPIYNLKPPKGTPADFGFNAGNLVQGHIYPTLDPAQDYAIKTVTPDISSLIAVRGSEVTFWGVPGDSAHDKFRYFSKETEGNALGASFGGAGIRPILTNPTDCGFDNGGARIRIESYQNPGDFTPIEENQNPLNVTGCEDPRFRFEPKIALQPTDRHAGAPTGLDVHLEVPQRNDEVGEGKELYAQNGNVKAIPTPPIKKAVVTFPEGMTISPSAAQGLGSCTSAQIGLGTDKPVTCPDNSQYGTLVLHTPILPVDAQPEGFIYIAKQNDNPFHDFLALYLVIEEPERGILVKVPGRVDLDPQTGQITTTFDDLPQFPVSDMQLSFKGGVRAALVNPSTCGTKTIAAEFFSWQDPFTPHPVESHYDVTQKPDGSPCVNSLAERQFKPLLSAGTLNNTAGSFSPFVFRLTRTDDDQEFSQLGVTLPTGLSAKLAGVSECAEAGIHQAEAPGGSGAEEQASPSCPVSSRIGTTEVGAGVGVPLTYVPGNVYLAGPYRGAPLSIVVISPAVVGPYDLGVIAVRSALRVDPETAQATVATDPFPQIFKGIPVRIRDIRVRTDRPSFTLNPTSCAEKQIAAHVTGTGGDVSSIADDTAADLSNRFQAADCASLAFKPSLSFRLFGATHRGAHPKFRTTLRARPGDANIAGASVALPRSEFLDQGHIRTVCTRVQFAQDQCPAGSIYGFARAKTPLLDKPLKGPVYLRSSSHQLPDLVVALDGQIEVVLASRVDSVNGGIRNSFEVIPDVPVVTFTLTMQGGKKGLLVNSTDLCAKTNRATARFTAQNGRAITLRPPVQSACGKKAHKTHRHKRRKR